MLPGSGEVICLKDPNHPQIGTCQQYNVSFCPMKTTWCKDSCIPEGDICHYKYNGGCPSNAINNDCCSAPGNKGFCRLDSVGVPRCFGLGGSGDMLNCIKAGGACATSADCCDGVPCVPNSMGQLVCGTMCVQPGGVCTATTDCCTGYVCVVPPGSTSGTCINPNPPPVSPDMAGGGPPVNYDLSTPPPMCALLGQSCNTTSSPCCTNNGNCLSQSTGGACTAGATNCICATPIL
jgi:hypothetical protein